MRAQALALAGRHRRRDDRRPRSSTRSPPPRGSSGRRSSARSSRALQTGIDTAQIDRAVARALGLPRRADGAHVLRAPVVVRPLRADVRRVARGLHAARAVAAALDRRARGYRRPRLADDRRRRRARPHDQVRDPRDVDRLRDGAARRRRRSVGEPDRGAAVHRRRRRSSSSGRAGTSATRRAATSGSAPPTRRWRARPARRSTAAAPSSRSASPPSGRARIDANLADAYASERYTLRLRTIWFPTVDVAYVLPVVAALAWGGWLVANGHASVGEVTTVVLYIQQLADPVDRLLSWLDEVQVGGASFARLVGIADVAARPRRRAARSPRTTGCARTTSATPTFPGRDVLHGIGLDLEPGERIAVVGPSGAGKSTLGRLLAGIHPPRTGSVKVGGVPLVDLELDDAAPRGRARHAGAARLRRHAGRQPAPARAQARRTPSCSPRSTPSTRRTGWRRSRTASRPSSAQAARR